MLLIVPKVANGFPLLIVYLNIDLFNENGFPLTKLRTIVSL